MVWERTKAMFGAYVDRSPRGRVLSHQFSENCSRTRASADFDIFEWDMKPLDRVMIYIRKARSSFPFYNLVDVKELSLFKHGLEGYRNLRAKKEKFPIRKQEIRDERASYIHKYLRTKLNFTDCLWTSKIIDSPACSSFLSNGKDKTGLKQELEKIVFIYNLTSECSDADRTTIMARLRNSSDVTEEKVLREVRSLVWDRTYGTKSEFFTISRQRSAYINGRITDADMEQFMDTFKEERKAAEELIQNQTSNCTEAIRSLIFERLKRTEVINEEVIQQQIRRTTWDERYASLRNVFDIESKKNAYVSGVVTDEDMDEFIRTADERRSEAIANQAKLKAQRKSELVAALAQRGLELRSDSVLCSEYIQSGNRSLPFIVEKMYEMHWLHSSTSYPILLASEFDEINRRRNYRMSGMRDDYFYNYRPRRSEPIADQCKRAALREFVSQNGRDEVPPGLLVEFFDTPAPDTDEYESDY
ncbi:hypothetical protein GEMRC1_010711 [Eukaryota sp. GEM-RC1]